MESDEEYYDEKCIDLILETVRKYDEFIFEKIRKNIRDYFKLGTLKFLPEIWESFQS